MATSAPSARNSAAVAEPIPPAPPVINADLPSSRPGTPAPLAVRRLPGYSAASAPSAGASNSSMHSSTLRTSPKLCQTDVSPTR